MNLENFSISLTSLKANKMRSLLTVLGVIIGVMAIILLVSIVAGTKSYIEDEIKAMGSNLFIVTPGNSEEMHGPPGTFSINKLKMSHVALVEAHSSVGVKGMPVCITMGNTVKYKRESRNTTLVIGTNEKAPDIRNWHPQTGRFFRTEDVDSARKVCAIGPTVEKDLYRGTNPLGKEIYINGDKFKILGVLEKKGASMGQDNDDIVLIPITTMHNLNGNNTVNQILFKVPDPINLSKSVLETKRILLREMEKEDFSVNTTGEMLQMFNTFANILGVVMGCVAGISLFVGGIGIMNIMLVTVKERTREIGIRKAVGASFKDILEQFIVEAVVISVSGGLLGIIISSALIIGVGPFLPFHLKVSPTAVIISFIFSSLTGIFFGTYPAVKAAKIDPIIALRYE